MLNPSRFLIRVLALSLSGTLVPITTDAASGPHTLPHHQTKQGAPVAHQGHVTTPHKSVDHRPALAPPPRQAAPRFRLPKPPFRRILRRPFEQEHPLRRTTVPRSLLRLPLAYPKPEPITMDPWKIRIVDGDTIAYGGDRIRIRGYDAQEKADSGGFEATQRLDALLHDGTVTMIPDGLDPYGRTLADVFVDGRNVAEVMKWEGYHKLRERGRP